MAEKKSGIIRSMKYSAIGIEMAAAVAVGAFIGYWLDEKLGTEPWMFMFWVICGVIAGFRSLYRMSKKIMQEKADNEDKRSD